MLLQKATEDLERRLLAHLVEVKKAAQALLMEIHYQFPISITNHGTNIQTTNFFTIIIMKDWFLHLKRGIITLFLVLVQVSPYMVFIIQLPVAFTLLPVEQKTAFLH